MAENIIIKKSYFDNIQVAINSLNDYFTSNFQNKNFPIIDGDYQLEGTIEHIIYYLNNVDPTWLTDSEKIVEATDTINEAINGINPTDGVYNTLVASNNKTAIDLVNAFMGFKYLQFIADNFQDFGVFVNGIYTFELFTTPSKFINVLEVFSKPIKIDEIPDMDLEERIFDEVVYVENVMKNDEIQLPQEMEVEAEAQRLQNRQDLIGIEILVDDSVQEAAEINYFTDTKPKHIKYDENGNTWKVSQQFQATINELIGGLRKCDSTDDLINYFESPNPKILNQLTETVCPFILAKLFGNSKKYKGDNTSENLKKYTDSYDSIISQNNGAKRFKNYDIFSTFKADKEGTIQFVEDFLKLNLVNKQDTVISNNTLLTLFNIFDSRIYLDILYNMLPDNKKKEQDEDSFVKEIRSRINQNSRNANTYKEDETEPVEGNEIDTPEEVIEYVSRSLKNFGDMSLADMIYCEHFHSLVKDEISTLEYMLYKEKISQVEIDDYIGESYNIIQEQETGDIPDYMKNRIALTYEKGENPDTKVTPVSNEDIPPDVPVNPIGDLTGSIDAKLSSSSSEGGIDSMLGSGYEDNPDKGKHKGDVVVNITNNYTNSFNKDSYNKSDTKTDDHSTGKTTTTTMTDSNNNSSHHNNNTMGSSSSTESKKSPKRKGSNNNNNSNDSVDIRNKDTIARDNKQKLSSGKTIQEMFVFLESSEPQSNGSGANNPPKADSLTKAMDRDKDLLKHQQSAKQKIQKTTNTISAQFKPVERTKQWLEKQYDELMKRDEDKVKADIIEDKNFRTSLKKAARIAMKFGWFGLFTAISGYFGAIYAGIEVLKMADKQRLKKEIQEECTAELEIMDDEIKRLGSKYNPTDKDLEDRRKLIRERSKLQHILIKSGGATIHTPKRDSYY